MREIFILLLFSGLAFSTPWCANQECDRSYGCRLSLQLNSSDSIYLLTVGNFTNITQQCNMTDYSEDSLRTIFHTPQASFTIPINYSWINGSANIFLNSTYGAGEYFIYFSEYNKSKQINRFQLKEEYKNQSHPINFTGWSNPEEPAERAIDGQINDTITYMVPHYAPMTYYHTQPGELSNKNLAKISIFCVGNTMYNEAKPIVGIRDNVSQNNFFFPSSCFYPNPWGNTVCKSGCDINKDPKEFIQQQKNLAIVATCFGGDCFAKVMIYDITYSFEYIEYEEAEILSIEKVPEIEQVQPQPNPSPGGGGAMPQIRLTDPIPEPADETTELPKEEISIKLLEPQENHNRSEVRVLIAINGTDVACFVRLDNNTYQTMFVSNNTAEHNYLSVKKGKHELLVKCSNDFDAKNLSKTFTVALVELKTSQNNPKITAMAVSGSKYIYGVPVLILMALAYFLKRRKRQPTAHCKPYIPE